jgi:SAM-dependent methyltransferase
MKNHFEHLLTAVPDLPKRTILDVGSGGGSFLYAAGVHGANATGIELNPEKVKRSAEKIAQFPNIRVVQGAGERLPFEDTSFEFVNLCELIEHVESPQQLLSEVLRILAPNGLVYMSVPNRFGLKDQHFNLYFLNWMPRSWGEVYISLTGKGKEYHKQSGLQRISEMHYYTFSGISKQARSLGFTVSDMRLMKLSQKPLWKRFFMLPLYLLLRPWYFDSFHLLLRRAI